MKKCLLLTAILVLAFSFAWADVVDNNSAVLSTDNTAISKAAISESANSPMANGTVLSVDMRSTDIQHRTVGTPITVKPAQGAALDAPPNDSCQNCIAISGTGTQDGTCVEATVDCPALNTNECVWFCIDAPNATNDIEIDFCKTYTELGGDIWTIWAVLFETCSCDTADFIAPDFFAWGEDPACNYQPIYRFYALPGPATYYLPVYVLDYYDALCAFRFDYAVTDAFVPPQGDMCDDPFMITSFPYTDANNSCDFRHDYGYPGEDVVYEFTLTECKDVTVSLCNSPDTFDTYLWLMDDCGVQAVATDDDGCMSSGYGLSRIEGYRLQAGTYWILVDAYSGNCGNYVLDVTVEDCPPPCDYNDCTEIDYDSLLYDGGTLVYEGNNYGATLDPNCDSLTTAMSWIYFHTEAQLDVKLEFCGTDPVRTGYYRILSPSCPCPPNGWVFAQEENDTECGDGNTTLYFKRLAAGSYWYPVIGDASEGPYLITLTAGPPTGYCDYTCTPGATAEGEVCGDDDNGGCNSAPPIFGSVSIDEHICGTVWGDGGTRDTDWFIWTSPPQDTMIIWSAAGSCPIVLIVMELDSMSTDGADTCCYTYLGGNGIAECETTSVITAIDGNSDIMFFVSTDGIYSGYPCADGPTGDGFPYEAWLAFQYSGPPVNDDCAYAFEIGEVTDYPFTNIGATTDNNGDCDPDLQSDVWYRYTPSSTGMAEVSLCDATLYDAFLGIFTDDCINHECIVYDDDGCGQGGGPSKASFMTTFGESYLICIGGWAGGMGNGEFDITIAAPPEIRVDPTTVDGTAPEGGMDTETLNVYNDGEMDLDFDVIVEQNTGAPFSASDVMAPIAKTPTFDNVSLSGDVSIKSAVNNSGSMPSLNDPETLKSVSKHIDLRSGSNDETATEMYCDLIMTGAQMYVLGAFGDGSEAAVFMDPAVCGDPSGTYPFQIDSLNIAVYSNNTVEEDVSFAVILYEADMTDPSCPVPGAWITNTPVYSYTFPAGGAFYGFVLDAPPLTCVNAPFFMSVYYPDAQEYVAYCMTDFATPPPVPCYSYFNDNAGSGWLSLFDAFAYDADWSEYYYVSGRTETCEAPACTVSCPGEGIAEAEVCGDSDNDGCNGDPVVFEDIAWNTIVCGTGYSTDADTGGNFNRDTDWYNFTTAGLTNIDIRITSEFPCNMYLLDATNCDSIGMYAAISLPSPCTEGRIYGTLGAGTYTIWVGPTVASVYCDESGDYGVDYNLSLDAEIAWLYTDIDAGTVVAPGPVPVEVTMDAAQLTEGDYYGNVIFESNDPVTPTTTIPVHFLVTAGSDCYEYMAGDVNQSLGLWIPRVIGGDVTFLVNFFKGSPTSVPCYMHNPSAGNPYFWASADANGDCIVMGSDVIKMVGYFRGAQQISYCVDYLPCWHPADPAFDPPPATAPAGWPNCETPPVTGSKIIPTQSK